MARHYSLQLLALLFGAVLSTTASAQGGLLRAGDQAYERFAFPEAIKAYEAAFAKGANSMDHARKLAESYWYIRDLRNAERWYAIVTESSQAHPEDLYRYSELLRTAGRYHDADEWLLRFRKLRPEDRRGLMKENATERLAELLSNDGLCHKVSAVPFNSEFSDMSPFIHQGKVYFSSARRPQLLTRNVDAWSGQPFLNLYTGSITPEGIVSDIGPMNNGSNTRYHESNVVITADGREMYFTRNGDGDLDDNGMSTRNLRIHVRRFEQGKWGKEELFPHNVEAHSSGHPALSSDGSRLYFTSDRPGGIGGKDLYVCYRENGGAWSAPRNLGPEINTEGDEMFPFVHDDKLYFSSDGHLGLGGLDLFRTTIRGTGFGPVTNLNAPMNSAFDDFGICLDEAGTMGMITSDRNGAARSEDLYLFHMNSRPEDDRKWTGRVLDMSDALPVPYLPVRLLDLQRNELAKTVTSPNGTYEFPAPEVPAMVSVSIPGGDKKEIPSRDIQISAFGDTDVPDLYINSIMDLPVNAIMRDGRTDEAIAGVAVTVKDTRDGSILFFGHTNAQGIAQGQIPDRRYGDDMNLEVTMSKEGYFTKRIQVDFRVLMFLDQALTGPEGTAMTPVEAGVDIAKAMNLRPIYFDFREHKIRSDAAMELDLVAQVMRIEPSIKIDLRSHTDSRASHTYNDALSQRRAESTRAYLIEQGIAADRITAHGHGERQLVNNCGDGVECTEGEHQLNRRTEFIVVSCDGCGTQERALPGSTGKAGR